MFIKKDVNRGLLEAQSILTESTRDESQQGRVNEFLRVVTIETILGVGTIVEKAVNRKKIEIHDINIAIERTEESLAELKRLRIIMSNRFKL